MEAYIENLERFHLNKLQEFVGGSVKYDEQGFESTRKIYMKNRDHMITVDWLDDMTRNLNRAAANFVANDISFKYPPQLASIINSKE